MWVWKSHYQRNHYQEKWSLFKTEGKEGKGEGEGEGEGEGGGEEEGEEGRGRGTEGNWKRLSSNFSVERFLYQND